ncbi:2-amino-3,7-dideoxy-D-threo-hept-6-ulosonate synthase [Desulfovibrio sp. OttesenSCG-928-G15]|nr:2-amino-3,7-dideoxy-D-threo-hept-6-ulosonate synthase [Desulfovibrio sp. OttesenSCG-928-G15]
MQLGKQIRLERFFNKRSGRAIIVPMDHGVTEGPLRGLGDVGATVGKVAQNGANAIVAHKGLALYCRQAEGDNISLIVHLSAGTSLSPCPTHKVLVTTVEEALRLGADGVSIHVNLGNDHDADMLRDFGRVAGQAQAWGLPLLAMVYARGSRVENEFDPKLVAHCARVGMELGADVVKVSYTGSVESFAQVTQNCDIPVLVAGGPKLDSDQAVLQTVYDSLQAGGKGISFGRNVFSHPAPDRLMRSLSGLVHEGWDVQKALDAMA